MTERGDVNGFPGVASQGPVPMGKAEKGNPGKGGSGLDQESPSITCCHGQLQGRGVSPRRIPVPPLCSRRESRAPVQAADLENRFKLSAGEQDRVGWGPHPVLEQFWLKGMQAS